MSKKTLISAEHELQCISKDNEISTIWDHGTLEKCKAELKECLREIPHQRKWKWRIVRVERHLVQETQP